MVLNVATDKIKQQIRVPTQKLRGNYILNWVCSESLRREQCDWPQGSVCALKYSFISKKYLEDVEAMVQYSGMSVGQFRQTSLV